MYNIIFLFYLFDQDFYRFVSCVKDHWKLCLYLFPGCAEEYYDQPVDYQPMELCRETCEGIDFFNNGPGVINQSHAPVCQSVKWPIVIFEEHLFTIQKYENVCPLDMITNLLDWPIKIKFYSWNSWKEEIISTETHKTFKSLQD